MRELISLTLLAFLLAACTPEQAKESVPTSEPIASSKLVVQGSDVTVEQIGGDFTLTNHKNQTVRLSDLQGKVVALIFGYAHCPDVCPTNLIDYSSAMNLLGTANKEVAVLFVSIDPKRDSAEALSSFIPMFDSSFIGLRTDDDGTLQDILKRYKVTVQLVPQSGGGYLVDHSAGSYLIDKQGKVRVYEPHGVPASQLAHDLKVLLESSS